MRTPRGEQSARTLREFVLTELGQQVHGMPLDELIRTCYREFLIRAHNGHKGKIPAGLLQEKLREIAAEFIRTRRHPLR